MHRFTMTLKKSEDAISPVIGVMLMLAVTIIIAAVVVAVSTGMVTETKTAPNAVFEVVIDRNIVGLDGWGRAAGPDLSITHISGDSVHSKDMKLFFSWTDPEGNFHESTYSSAEFSELCPGGIYIPDSYGYMGDPIYTSMIAPRSQPLYQKGHGGDGPNALDHYFGDVVFAPGVKVMATPDFLLYSSESNVGSPFMDAILNNGVWANPNNGYWSDVKDYNTHNYEVNYDDKFFGEDASYVPGLMDSASDCWIESCYLFAGGIMDFLPAGTPVDVKILHIPSNKIIYDKVVYVGDTLQDGTEWAEDLYP